MILSTAITDGSTHERYCRVPHASSSVRLALNLTHALAIGEIGEDGQVGASIWSSW